MAIIGFLSRKTTSVPILYNYNAGQDDVFLDDVFIDTLTGVNTSFNKPIKYVNNPVFNKNGETSELWDWDKGYPNVLNVGGSYKMWYASLRTGGVPPYLIAYATSSDGLTWVRPELHLVTYEGNNNNNLIIGLGAFALQLTYNPDLSADLLYVGALTNNPQSGGDWNSVRTVNIWKSADGLTWTQIKALTPTGSPYLETSAILRISDGRWIVYYIKDGLIDRRKIAAFVSDTTDPAGTWTDQGVVINTTLGTDQKYGTTSFYSIDGLCYGIVSNFNSTTDIVIVDLYISRNGLTWSKKSSNWVPIGLSGQWDDSMIFTSGMPFIRVNNQWQIYYAGSAEDHAHALPRDSRIGFATIGYKRIGQVTGIGTLITTAFTPTDVLKINSKSASNRLRIELLDTNNNVISGFSRNDMDNYSYGDYYDKIITWNGNNILMDRDLKIKFYFL